MKQKSMFSWTSLAFSMIQWMLAIWSLVPLPFLKEGWTSGSSLFMYYWSLAWRRLSIYFASMWDECNFVVIWAFFGIAFLWDWNENLNSIWKSRDITLPTKVHLVKAMVFPVVMYGCENWTIKKAEHQRIDAFELWCWKRLLRVPWTARRSNQSILKEISPEYSLEGRMLKLKLQYFDHLMPRADSLEKTLMLGKIQGKRRRDNRG